MRKFFRRLSAALDVIAKSPPRVESSLQSLVDLQARALDAANRQSDLLRELIDLAQRLFPAHGELGWDDPRLPSSLFRARCLEAQAETLQVIRDEMPTAICELDHRAFLLDAVARAPGEGDILEFGVFSGATLRWMAEAYPARRFVGFDSFRGLPSDWTGYKTFNFDRAGSPPELPGNVELAIGDFSQTLAAFASGAPRIAMLHIDCDLYESAHAALDALGPHLKPGAILVFDEYFNYPGFRAHEYRACAEFLAQAGRRIEWLVYSGERAMGRLA
jgi:predicted O-methyltransferase YrrM